MNCGRGFLWFCFGTSNRGKWVETSRTFSFVPSFKMLLVTSNINHNNCRVNFFLENSLKEFVNLSFPIL